MAKHNGLLVHGMDGGSGGASGGAVPRPQLHAVVLSGSGGDGAYQVGVLKALCQGESPATGRLPLQPRVFAGTSTGAFNASLLVARWDDDGGRAVHELERVWLDRLSRDRFANGSFRMRLNPLELLDSRAGPMGPGSAVDRLWGDFRDLGRAGWTRARKLWTSPERFLDWLADNFDVSMLMATDPWKETIAESIDFEKIHASRQRLTIATMNWDTGDVCHFGNRDGLEAVRPEVVRAASAVPGVHGSERVNGRAHVDGASLMIAPVKPALEELHEIARSEPGEVEFHLHVIYMCARQNAMPSSALESLLQTLYGSQVINWSSRIDQDLERAREINQGLVIIEDLAALHEHEEGGAREPETEAIRRIRERVARMPKRERIGLLTSAREIMRRQEDRGEWKKLTIHRYFPARGLDSTLGFLDFRRSRLQSLIDQGHEDAVGHDCQANGCVRIVPGRRAGGRLYAQPAPAPPLEHSSRHALILSGGGAYGAYQAGVAKALFQGDSPSTGGEPLKPEVFAGTSIGAFNASFLVSKWNGGGTRAVASLERAWLERLSWRRGTNGVFRVRLNPFELLSVGKSGGVRASLLRQLDSDVGHLLEQMETRGRNLFRPGNPFLERLASCFDPSPFVAAEPWEKTIEDLIDFEEIQRSSRRLTIAATNWTDGKVLDFGNHDNSTGGSISRNSSRRPISRDAIRASSAVPGFYPPAVIDGQTCVDGAVLMNTPLKPAIDELRELPSEAEEAHFVLHVVYMSGEIEKSSMAEGTLQTLFRSQAIHWGSTVEQDIEHARALNQGLSLLVDMVIALGKQPGTDLRPEEIEAIRAAVAERSPDEGKRLLEVSEKILQRREENRPYKQLTIHRYFPRKGLSGVLGFLDVRRSTLENLINEGFQDAVDHDCVANECVLVTAPP